MKFIIFICFFKNSFKIEFMLDLDKIRKQFNEILYSFTREDLENWLRFAEEREERERLEELNEEESIEMAKKSKVTVVFSTKIFKAHSFCE